MKNVFIHKASLTHFVPIFPYDPFIVLYMSFTCNAYVSLEYANSHSNEKCRSQIAEEKKNAHRYNARLNALINWLAILSIECLCDCHALRQLYSIDCLHYSLQSAEKTADLCNKKNRNNREKKSNLNEYAGRIWPLALCSVPARLLLRS